MITTMQGISTGLKTDALVAAVLAQEGKGVTALQARESRNKTRITALNSLKTGLNNLSISLAVASDRPTATSVQDVVTKFNAMLTAYKKDAAVTRNSDGSINQGPLATDFSAKSIVVQTRGALTSSSGSTTHPNLSSIGIKTQADGTLSFNSSTFEAALAADPVGVQSLLAFTDAKSTITNITASTPSSPIVSNLHLIEEQNKNLALQINSGLAALARRKKVLDAQFTKMETLIGQMKAAAGQLTGLA